MKTRYLIILSILPKIAHSAHEIERPQERIPTEDNRITEERTEAEKQKLLKNRVEKHYEKSSIFSSSKGRYTEKFNTLPPEIKDLILDLGTSPQTDVLLEKLKKMNNKELQESSNKITEILRKESASKKGVLNSGDRSERFIDDLTKVEKRIQEKLKSPRTPKAKIERTTTLEEAQAKDIAKKQEEARAKLQAAKGKNAKAITMEFKQNLPEVARTPEEQLLTQYELGVSHHSFTPSGTSTEIALPDRYHPSAANDPKAVRIINQLTELQKNPETNKTEITSLKKQLTDHFTKLRDLAEEKYSTEYLAHNEESSKAYISLRDYFAKEIQHIKESPWFPKTLEEKRTELYARKKELRKEKAPLMEELTQLQAAARYGEDPEANRKIEELKAQLKPINKKINEIDKNIMLISNIETGQVSPDQDENTSASEQRTTEAKPKPKPEPAPTQPKEKSAQERALDDLHKKRDKLVADRKKLYDEINRLNKKIDNPLLLTPTERADWPEEKAQLEKTIDTQEAKEKKLTQQISDLAKKITELTRATQDNRITSQEDADAANEDDGGDW